MYAVASARRSYHQSIIYSLVAPIPTDLYDAEDLHDDSSYAEFTTFTSPYMPLPPKKTTIAKICSKVFTVTLT